MEREDIFFTEKYAAAHSHANRDVLSVLLQRRIGDIVVHAQAIKPGITPQLRGICLDVEITESLDADKDTLKTWTKLAAKSDTMQDFLKRIE